jgi:DNA-binding MarR family transcriptional regulator
MYIYLQRNSDRMKLEAEIKQTNFRDEYHKASLNIVYTANWLQNRQAAFFREYDLTGPQFNILRILRGQYPQPATVNLLIERMLDKTSNASRIVDKLVLKNLVTRRQCEHDRRTVDVLISPKGLELLQKIDAASFPFGVENLTADEARQLNQLLDKIRN